MKLDNLNKRLSSLEPEGFCPHCDALESMTSEEIDDRLWTLYAGQPTLNLPDSNPSCLKCRREAAELDSMTEEELDAELARLKDILKEAVTYEA